MARSRVPEVDLHGYSVAEAMERFARAYNSSRAGGREARLIVIHGWNAAEFKGSIASALHRLLKRRGVSYEHPFEGNIGRTAVRLGAALPEKTSRADGPKPEAMRKPSGTKAGKRRLSGGL